MHRDGDGCNEAGSFGQRDGSRRLDVGPIFKARDVRPVVDRDHAFEGVREGLERVKSNLGFGKVVLKF